MKDGAWYRSVTTPRPGLSVVAVRADVAGTYMPVVASAAPGWRPSLTFTIDRLGVVPAAVPSESAR